MKEAAPQMKERKKTQMRSDRLSRKHTVAGERQKEEGGAETVTAATASP